MAELLKEHESDIGGVRVIPSKGGVFEVSVNGALVFSKRQLQRHAEAGEVLRLVREKLAAA